MSKPTELTVIRGTVRHNKNIFRAGTDNDTFECGNAKEAAALIRAGACVEVGGKSKASRTTQSKAGSKTKKQDAGLSKTLDQAELIEAIKLLTPGNPEHWTNDNKPEVKALAEITGQKVTAEERDAAWSALQALEQDPE